MAGHEGHWGNEKADILKPKREHHVTTLLKVIYHNPSLNKGLTKKSGIRMLKPGPILAIDIAR